MAEGQKRTALSASRPTSLSAEEERIVQAMLSAIRRIRYGSVQIVVQDGRAVQIDTVEKTRLAK